MANILDTIGKFIHEAIEPLNLMEPWWLLLALLPVSLGVSQFWYKSQVADLNHRSSVVHAASIPAVSRWPGLVISTCLLLSMLGLVYPAARPVHDSREVTEDALVVWVYDASESMSTVDVVQGDQLVSRLEASITALEESLPTVASEHYKLLISFAEVQKVNVNIPTLNNDDIISQARNIALGEFTATDFGLERAISACQQFFASWENSPCEIILLSDGECNPRPQCHQRADALSQQAAQQGMVIHTISWGDSKSEFRPNTADMRKIAEAGGGRHLPSTNTAELTQLYSEVITGPKTEIVSTPLAAVFVWSARVGAVLLGLAYISRRHE